MLQAGELYRAKRYPEALTRFEALRHRAETAGNAGLRRSVLNNIGLCRLQMGELARAESVFVGLMAEDPYYVKAINNLGKVRVAQGKKPEAAALFQKVLDIDPQNRMAREELAKLAVH